MRLIHYTRGMIADVKRDINFTASPMQRTVPRLHNIITPERNSATVASSYQHRLCSVVLRILLLLLARSEREQFVQINFDISVVGYNQRRSRLRHTAMLERSPHGGASHSSSSRLLLQHSGRRRIATKRGSKHAASSIAHGNPGNHPQNEREQL